MPLDCVAIDSEAVIVHALLRNVIRDSPAFHACCSSDISKPRAHPPTVAPDGLLSLIAYADEGVALFFCLRWRYANESRDHNTTTRDLVAAVVDILCDIVHKT